MRKVTKKAAEAFINGHKMTSGNTKVMGGGDNFIMTLHDNVIATREGSRIILTDSGWQTATTKERLNGVLSEMHSEWRLYQLSGKWYITDGAGVRKDWVSPMEFEV